MNNLTNRILLIALIWLCAGPATALSTDREKPINIEADWFEADDVRRTTVYKGGVIITQGTIRITGDTVTMYYDKAYELTKLVSVGRPARFRQRPDGKPGYQRASAAKMEYYADRNLLILLGDAHYAEGEEKKLSGNRIVYNTLEGRVKAETDKAKKERVRITVIPKRKCEGKDCPPSN